MGRLSRSTVRCSLRPWEGPWTTWTPWTLFQCQDPLGCEATAMWGQSTRAVLEKKREKEGGHCSYFRPRHQGRLPLQWEPFKAAQVKINTKSNKIKQKLKFIVLHWILWVAYKWDHLYGVVQGVQNTYWIQRSLSPVILCLERGMVLGLLKPAGMWLHIANEVLEISENWRELMSIVFQSGWGVRAWCRRVFSADEHSGAML